MDGWMDLRARAGGPDRPGRGPPRVRACACVRMACVQFVHAFWRHDARAQVGQTALDVAPPGPADPVRRALEAAAILDPERAERAAGKIILL